MDKEIFDFPWYKFRITNFLYECSSDDSTEHFIELEFTNELEKHKLRFNAPRQLQIEEGFPNPTQGFILTDISERQLENLNIAVENFENSGGAITFLAKAVFKIY